MQKNQRSFFKQFHIEEKEFIVDEFAWPFPESVKGAKGIKQKNAGSIFCYSNVYIQVIVEGKIR